MFDPETDTISLIDYGQLIEVPEDYRKHFARLIISIETHDVQVRVNTQKTRFERR